VVIILVVIMTTTRIQICLTYQIFFSLRTCHLLIYAIFNVFLFLSGRDIQIVMCAIRQRPPGAVVIIVVVVVVVVVVAVVGGLLFLLLIVVLYFCWDVFFIYIIVVFFVILFVGFLYLFFFIFSFFFCCRCCSCLSMCCCDNLANFSASRFGGCGGGFVKRAICFMCRYFRRILSNFFALRFPCATLYVVVGVFLVLVLL